MEDKMYLKEIRDIFDCILTNKNVKIGNYIKVLLPGENAWVEIIKIISNYEFIGRINCKLLHEYSEFEQAKLTKSWYGEIRKLPKVHNYKQGDIIHFIKNRDKLFIPKI